MTDSFIIFLLCGMFACGVLACWPIAWQFGVRVGRRSACTMDAADARKYRRDNVQLKRQIAQLRRELDGVDRERGLAVGLLEARNGFLNRHL